MPDVRLIDANALLEDICKKCPENDCKPDATDTVSGCLIYDMIASAPTVEAIPLERWKELKETIIEMRDNGGTGTQEVVCKFLTNFMEILKKEGKNDGEDAQPVKHGKWVRASSGELYCSNCEYVPQWDDDNFCANCGAKMDGGD